MRQLSQRELLDEGFWDGFKKVAGGIGRAAKTAGKVAAAGTTAAGRLVDIALPEVTKPIKGAVSAFRDVKNAAKSAWDVLKPKMDKIRESLKDQGFILDETQEPQKAGNSMIVWANEIIGYDKATQQFKTNPNKTVTFMVDSEGNAKRAPNVSVKTNNGNKGKPKTNSKTNTNTASNSSTPPTPPPQAPTNTQSNTGSTPTPTRQPRPVGSPTKRKP